MRIEVKIDDKQVMKALKKLEKAAASPGPMLNEIGAHIVSEVDLNFRDQTDPYGNDWPLLSASSTLIREDSSGNLIRKGDVPLNDTGRLKASITHNVSGKSVEVGTNVEYAPTHQLGAKKGQYGKNIPWGDVPARPFLPTEEGGLPSDMEREIINIINDHLEDVLK